jgi:Kelch motif
VTPLVPQACAPISSASVTLPQDRTSTPRRRPRAWLARSSRHENLRVVWLLALASALTACGPTSRMSGTSSLPPTKLSAVPSTNPTDAGAGRPGTFTSAQTPKNLQGFAPLATLADGRVLLFGVNPESIAYYDSGKGTYSSPTVVAGLQGWGPFQQMADGRILVSDMTSGLQFGVFDPATAKVTKTAHMLVDQANAKRLVLADGRVLLTGGTDEKGSYLSAAEIYDPTSGSFSATGPMLEPRDGHCSILLADGRVLIAGGDRGSSGTSPKLLSSAEIFDPSTDRFTSARSLLAPRTQFNVATLADGRVLIVGGLGLDKQGLTQAVSTAEFYDPVSGRFTAAGSMSMTRGTNFGITRLRDGRVLIAGGMDQDGNSLSSAELYEPTINSFVPTGPMLSARNANAFLLPDGRVFITGREAPPELYWP